MVDMESPNLFALTLYISPTSSLCKARGIGQRDRRKPDEGIQEKKAEAASLMITDMQIFGEILVN